jgi:hypothetical protein
VIGGIIVSTVLSLVVVPAFFLILDDLSRLLARIFSRLVGKKEQEIEPLSAEAMTVAVAELHDRLAAVEHRQPRAQQAATEGKSGSNVVSLPPLAAE